MIVASGNGLVDGQLHVGCRRLASLVSRAGLPADGGGSGGGAPAAAPAAPATGASGATPLLDGPGKYELAGIISHMGANTACGHYVCHIRGPDGHWALFNDEKVAASEQPPFDLGYLYLYRRAQH